MYWLLSEAEVGNEETATNEGKEEKVLMMWRDTLSQALPATSELRIACFHSDLVV